jgi:hypothetical protein
VKVAVVLDVPWPVRQNVHLAAGGRCALGQLLRSLNVVDEACLDEGSVDAETRVVVHLAKVGL